MATAADRRLRAAGTLLAWAATACALVGTFHHPAGQSRGAVALAATVCACAALLAWAFVPEPGVHRTMGVHQTPLWHTPAPRAPSTVSQLPSLPASVPPTAAIALPEGNQSPRAAAPQPLYAADELALTTSTGEAQSPFLEDALFQLEDPGPGAWLMRVGKDPTQLCQDSFACDPVRRVYAVTDGVSRSFMPAAWARIIARAAVAHPEPFSSEAELAAWLAGAADRWRAWMREVWLPRVQASTGGRGRPYEARDWDSEIDGQGAQTTLVCCSVSRCSPDAPTIGGGRSGDTLTSAGGRPAEGIVAPPMAANVQDAVVSATKGEAGSVRVDVTAIGDSECLLFRQGAGRWELVAAFPLEHPADFGASPATLSTQRDPARMSATYRSLRRAHFAAHPGDRLALATDAVACWLLAQARAYSPDAPTESASPSPSNDVGARHAALAGGEDPTARLLNDPASALRLALLEIDAGRLEDDDLTLLVIAIT